jgi:hypothetical protein
VAPLSDEPMRPLALPAVLPEPRLVLVLLARCCCCWWAWSAVRLKLGVPPRAIRAAQHDTCRRSCCQAMLVEK